MLTLKDVLALSTCSKFTAGLGISADAIHKLIEENKSSTHLANFRLSFSSELTTGLLRRMLNRLNSGTEASIYIDSGSGRIILDIGSAFNNKDAYLATNVEVLSDDESDGGRQEIFKDLENYSVDEYDDFNPRHPKPRERAHRRGDSYFNSDIEQVVTELYSDAGGASPFSMKDLAAAAHAPAPPVPAAMGGPPKAPPTVGLGAPGAPGAAPAGDLKSRLLAKKKAAAAAKEGQPPRASSPLAMKRLPYQMRASAELNGDSDEDDEDK